MKVIKLLFFVWLIAMSEHSMIAQELLTVTDSSDYYEEDLKPVKIINPKSSYAYYLNRVRKLYPYALYAADVLHDLDDELNGLDKKRQIRKTSKAKQKELFKEFNYMIKDLYRSEGVLLMKLIHRETGMTVNEIIRTYRNKSQANIYTGMAKLFHQDLKVTYKPKSEDRMIERIILDIKNEEVYFDNTYKKVTKQDYKEGMRIYRANKKANRKEFRKLKKAEKAKKKIDTSIGLKHK